jgi:hypothetical protein
LLALVAAAIVGLALHRLIAVPARRIFTARTPPPRTVAQGSDSDAEAIAVYQIAAHWRPQRLVTAGLVAVVGTAIAITAATNGTTAGVAFGVAWGVLIPWNVGLYLWKTAGYLAISGEALAWQTPLRSGTFPLREIVEVRPWQVRSAIAVIATADGGRLYVPAQKGFAPFTEQLANRLPGTPIDPGGYARLAQRLSGPSRLIRGGDA